jgi:hypothetical protein
MRDGYALSSEASSSWNFVKTEPLSPLSDDYNFAYACDVAETKGSKPGHIVELPF